VGIKILVHGNAPVPGRVFMVDGGFAVAVLAGDDEGEGVKFKAALVVAIGEFEIVAGTDIHIWREDAVGPMAGGVGLGRRQGGDGEGGDGGKKIVTHNL